MKHIELTGGIMYPFGAYVAANLPDVLHMRDVLVDAIGVDKSVAFWCRGSSGAMLAAIMCSSFPHCVINHVKKDGENSHANRLYMRSDIVVIIDDFMASGNTLNSIYDEFHKFSVSPWSVDSPKVDYLCIFGTVAINALNFVPDTIVCEHVAGNMFKDDDQELNATSVYDAIINTTDDDCIPSDKYSSDVLSGFEPLYEEHNVPP